MAWHTRLASSVSSTEQQRLLEAGTSPRSTVHRRIVTPTTS